jgi:uncharacterized protein with HEPN domain
MTRDWGESLDDILESIAEVKAFTRGHTYVSFSKDRKTANAVIRSLEVVGEAAKRIPDGCGQSILKSHENEWRVCETN